jgi:hypothetical protein
MAERRVKPGFYPDFPVDRILQPEFIFHARWRPLDNGYSSPQIYALLGLLGVKPLIGFRARLSPHGGASRRPSRLARRRTLTHN